MVQLSHFPHAPEVLTLADALGAMVAAVMPMTAAETIALAAADGRVLAAPIVAAADLPAFANSAVDGYAVALADLVATDRLRLAGRITAGSVPDPLESGTCARIFTGAPLPCGADTVFMQEDVVLQDGEAIFRKGLANGDNARLRGEDLARGSVAVPAGRRLRPQDLALAAAVGAETVRVARRLKAALFSTGNELVEPGTPATMAQRYDSNRVMLATLLTRAGVQVTDLGILPDDRRAISDALGVAAAGHDLVVTSGGVSVGEEDHVKAAIAAHGALTLWRLAIKPGRPLAFGRVGSAVFVGLPGNPVAAFVTFTRVLRPLVARMAGEAYEPVVLRAAADFTHRKRAGLREYVRATLTVGPDGAPRAAKHGVDGAAILTSLADTNGLVELVESVSEVARGDLLPFLPYEALF